MVEIPIMIINSDLVENYKSNGQIIYPYVSFSPHSVTGTPTQACPASYKTHPVNTVKVDADNFQYEVEIPRGLSPFQVKTIWLFDQEDQLIGYATLDLPYLGSAKLSVRLLINYTGWPGVDPWENMNQMVQNEVNVLEGWRTNAEAIDTGIPRLWNRTIYVDQVNGDDENPGTQDAPVKTLKHAIEDMVPVGGMATIRVLSDYTLQQIVEVRAKRVVIRLDGVKLTAGIMEGTPTSSYNSYGHFGVKFGGSIRFQIEQWNPQGTPPGIIIPYAENLYYKGLIRVSGDTGGTADFWIRNKVEGANIIDINAGFLIYHSNYSARKPQLNLFLSGHFTGNIRINGGYIAGFSGAVGICSIKFGGIQVIDGDGNQVNIWDYVTGIVRDSNGVPRNIISNVVL